MKKKVLDLFKKSSSEILFSVFCLSIVAIGMGFFYWHLQNLDFFSFKVLSEGVIKLNGDQIKEILRLDSCPKNIPRLRRPEGIPTRDGVP